MRCHQVIVWWAPNGPRPVNGENISNFLPQVSPSSKFLNRESSLLLVLKKEQKNKKVVLNIIAKVIFVVWECEGWGYAYLLLLSTLFRCTQQKSKVWEREMVNDSALKAKRVVPSLKESATSTSEIRELLETCLLPSYYYYYLVSSLRAQVVNTSRVLFPTTNQVWRKNPPHQSRPCVVSKQVSLSAS